MRKSEIADADRAEAASEAPRLNRRELLAYTAAFGGAFLGANGIVGCARAEDSQAAAAPPPPARTYDMKKSINLWALPYPQKMTLRQCLQLCKDAGFDGVEVNYDLEGDLSPKASEANIQAIGRMARDIGIQISGVCSFLFWPYAFTHQARGGRESTARRRRAIRSASAC